MAVHTVTIDDGTIGFLADFLIRCGRLMHKLEKRRHVVGIAGIGGSGKSTVARMLVEAICARAGKNFARLVPMDGFHLPNRTLAERNLREVKGAPQTFDAEAFIQLLREVKRHMPRHKVHFPIYDRALHEPVLRNDAATAVGPGARVVVTEGNYLLLNEPPWWALGQVLDECWLVDTPIEQAREWIIARHVAGGRDAADAARHYERADLPNARLILGSMRAADLRMCWPEPREPAQTA